MNMFKRDLIINTTPNLENMFFFSVNYSMQNKKEVFVFWNCKGFVWALGSLMALGIA